MSILLAQKMSIS